MKRASYLVLAILLCLTCLLCVGCDSDNKMVGTYKFNYTTINYDYNNVITIKAGESFFGITYSKDIFVLKLKKDHSFTLKSSLTSMFGVENVLVGIWSVDGNNLVLFSDGETIRFSISKKIITLYEDGTVIALKKQ